MGGGTRLREVAQFFKILSDESRLQILWLLLLHKELCVCDVVEALGVPQPRVSRHLAALRHAGLVNDRKDGAWAHYSLCPISGALEQSVLNALRSHLAGHPDAAPALKKLNRWMKNRAGKAQCPAKQCCNTTP
jgi:ArsR family transcriptional regulator